MAQPIIRLHHDTEDGPTALWSPDGSKILTYGENVLQLFYAANGTRIAEMIHGGGGVFQAQWSRTGEFVLSASSSGTARLWSGDDGHEIFRLQHRPDMVRSKAFWNQDESLILTSFNNTVGIWSAKTGKQLQCFECDTRIASVSWFAAETQVMTACDGDKGIQFWDVTSGEKTVHLQPFSYRYMKASINPAQTQLVCYNYNPEQVELWNLQTFQREHTLLAQPDTAFNFPLDNGPIWSPDNTMIVTTGTPQGKRYKTLDIWQTKTGAHIQTIQYPESIWQIEWSSDSQFILVGSQNGTARLWQVGQSEPVWQLPHESSIEHFTWLQDENLLITQSARGHVRLWDTDTQDILFHVTYEGTTNSAQLHPTDNKLLISWIGNDIDVYNVDLPHHKN